MLMRKYAALILLLGTSISAPASADMRQSCSTIAMLAELAIMGRAEGVSYTESVQSIEEARETVDIDPEAFDDLLAFVYQDIPPDELEEPHRSKWVSRVHTRCMESLGGGTSR